MSNRANSQLVIRWRPAGGMNVKTNFGRAWFDDACRSNHYGRSSYLSMEEFEGRSPAELISKGETGRLWASLFYLRSGMPE